MAGFSDFPFRKLCREFGASFSFTEMISAKSLLLNVEVNRFYLPKPEEKDFVGIQLFGSDPTELAEAARLVADRGLWVDLNAGCPVAKVVKRGAGSGLLRDLGRLRSVVRAMRATVKRLTVKTRIGWEVDEFQRIYDLLVEEGVDAIFVHGRTAKQMYTGKARWDVYNPGHVPLYISGDLFTRDDIRRALEVSGANGVIVARGAIGNPWIFSDHSPTVAEIFETMVRHVSYLQAEYGDYAAVTFRKFVAGYTAGLPYARELRRKVVQTTTVQSLVETLRRYFSDILSLREESRCADLPR